jgi:hypothetical protein
MASSPNDLERSLLQKAVRRGNVEVVEKVVGYLQHVNDFKWLRKRLAVIAYEECWTYADQLLYPKQPYKLLDEYKTLTTTIKNLNADALASLAMKVKEGVSSALIGSSKDKRAIQTVANAIKKPEEFWDWIKKQPDYKKYAKRINAAERDIDKADFEGDKAMMFAAAYLALKYPIPETKFTNPNNDIDFPYWIALDKHTSLGRTIYSQACQSINIWPTRGLKIGFYLEGAVVNQMTNSPFWDLVKEWKMNRIGYSIPEAEEIWNKLKPILIGMSKLDVDLMVDRINNYKNNSRQKTLNF